MAQPASGEPHAVKSALRTIQILEVLADAPTRLSFAELQDRTGFPRSSLFALIRTLRALKWIEADESGARFSVGPHALVYGTAYLDRDPALPHALQTIEDIRADLGYTAHYARRDGASVIYLATRESRLTSRAADQAGGDRVGRRVPAHLTALGQALLAELTYEEVEKLLPAELQGQTADSLTDRAELHAALDEVRQRGWSHERGQSVAGIGCVARAVGYRIPATDAISCAFPVSAADDPAELDRISDAVVTHTDRLTATLRRQGIR